MRVTRNVAVIALVSAALASGVAVPAAAAGEQIQLDCLSYAPDEPAVDVIADVTLDGATYTGTATLETRVGSGAWASEEVLVDDGFLWESFENLFARYDSGTFDARLTVGDSTAQCSAFYAPALIDYSGTLSVAAGGTVRVLADALIAVDNYGDTDLPLAELQIETADGWNTVATSRLTKYATYALLDYKPSGWANARLAVRSNSHGIVGVSDTFLIDVTYSKATVTAKSSSAIQSKQATATARIGNHATTGKATLQRKSGSSWVTVTSKSFTAGTAVFSWSQKATTSYRVVMTPTGKAASTSSSFTVKYVPAVSATPAKTSGVDGANIPVTVVHRLTSTGFARLQFYSGGTWHTYESFALSSTGTTKIGLVVTSTRTWRVLVGSYASASFVVTKR